MIDEILCILKAFANWLLDGIGYILNFLIGWLINLLPTTPFQFEQVEWGPFGQLIGYFIPVASMFTHFTLILVSIGVYYVLRHLLRLVKMVK